MTLRLAPRGTEECCECSEFVDCDCGAIEVSVQCRTRGGVATLCGISEYTGAATPPKKYRKQTPAGENWGCASFSGGSCSGDAGNRFRFTYAGQYVFNSASCAESNTQEITAYNLPLGVPCTYESGTPQTPGGLGIGWSPQLSAGADLTETPTTRTWEWDGSCKNWTGLGIGQITGSVTSTLSEEDTEDDAIDRLLAGSGATWSTWTRVGDGSGGTCINPECCTAKWEARTAGFALDYEEAEARVYEEDLTPGDNYEVEFDIYRRAEGSSDDWELFTTLESSGSVDGFGILQVEVEVPNARGYETYAGTLARIRKIV